MCNILVKLSNLLYMHIVHLLPSPPPFTPTPLPTSLSITYVPHSDIPSSELWYRPPHLRDLWADLQGGICTHTHTHTHTHTRTTDIKQETRVYLQYWFELILHSNRILNDHLGSVAVLGRFCCIFWPHYRVRNAVTPLQVGLIHAV